jgi:site-specific DNA-methyltransferase (adenine-specific)
MNKINLYNGTLYNCDAEVAALHLEPESIDCIVTSPPYWALRDYGVEGQLGAEDNYCDYIKRLVGTFASWYPKLKGTGALWVNLGDTYMNKSLVGIPDRFKTAMINWGWKCRNEIIWHKPRCIPQSAKDRFTVDFEKLYFFTKSENYYFKQQYEPYSESSLTDKRYGKEEIISASNKPTSDDKYQNPIEIKNSIFLRGLNKNGRNKRSVWHITPANSHDAHFAVFPEKLIETPIEATCPAGGVVCDPFAGSGTTLKYAQQTGRRYIGVELNIEYCELIKKRLSMPLLDKGVKI